MDHHHQQMLTITEGGRLDLPAVEHYCRMPIHTDRLSVYTLIVDGIKGALEMGWSQHKQRDGSAECAKHS